MGSLRTATLFFALCLSVLHTGAARAATSQPPADFVGVPLGSSLSELKQRIPDVARSPESDKKFQVYQTLSLKGADVKSAAAFDIYDGRVVGGQILLDSYNERYWYNRMVERYGKPDNCEYCEDAELLIANWMWGNGVRLHIGGQMLTLLTEEGAVQRHEWIARGDTSEYADKGDEESDLGAEPSHAVVHKKVNKKTPPPTVVAKRQPTKWDTYYENAKSRFSRIMGWSK